LLLAAAMTGLAGVTALAGPLGSATAQAPAPPDFYGIAATTAMGEKDFNRLARANIRTVRVVMYWPAIATGRGKYNWLNFDGTVIHAAAAGVRVVPTLLGSPSHISERPLRPPLDSIAEQEQWQDFVRSAVQRYGPGGEFWDFVDNCPPDPGHCRPDIAPQPFRVWQVWNEPNLGGFWEPEPSPARYADLLALTDEAVHDTDPGAEVITAGITPSRSGAPDAIKGTDFAAQLYQAGGADSFDGLSINPYKRKPKQSIKKVKQMRALTSTYGDAGTPLWVTEIGWSTRGRGDSELVTSRRGQAKRLRKSMKKLTALRETLNIESVSWFTYKDINYGLCDWCWGAGLFNSKGKPKRAWNKYVQVTGGSR
jgi:hypothetical protein